MPDPVATIDENSSLRLDSYRIPSRNLRLFLELLSEEIKYDFSEADWDGVWYGLPTSRACTFEYPLMGDRQVDVAFSAVDPGGCVLVSLRLDSDLAQRSRALASALMHLDRDAESMGLLNYLEEVFPCSHFPAGDRIVSCSDEHFRQCLECQEAKETFGRPDWLRVADGGVPMGYADLCFLTVAAYAYFLPAYVYTGLKQKNPEPLERALEWHPDMPGMTQEQKELVRLVARLL